MRYKISQEAETPHQESLDILDQTIETLLQIPPDRTDIESWAKSYVSGSTKRFRIAYDLDYVKRFATTGEKILEVGSVPLMLTTALKNIGYNVTGVDVDPSRFQKTITKLELSVIQCDIETERLPFEDNSFDVVIFNELFEHMRINPIFTMGEIHRVMKKEGLLLLSTPNLRSLDGISNFLLRNQAHSAAGDIYEEFIKLETIGHMGHVREYTTTEVCNFLRKIGFNIEEIIFRGQADTHLRKTFLKFAPQFRPFMMIKASKQ